MPQLIPFFFVNQISFTFLTLLILIYVFSKYILPSFTYQQVVRLYITKLTKQLASPLRLASLACDKLIRAHNLAVASASLPLGLLPQAATARTLWVRDKYASPLLSGQQVAAAARQVVIRRPASRTGSWPTSLFIPALIQCASDSYGWQLLMQQGW